MMYILTGWIKEKMPYGTDVALLGIDMWQYVAWTTFVVGVMGLTWVAMVCGRRVGRLFGMDKAMWGRIEGRVYYLSVLGGMIYGKRALGLAGDGVWEHVFTVLGGVFVVMSLLFVDRLLDVLFGLLNRKMRASQWEEIGILQLLKGFAKVGGMVLTLLLVSSAFFDYDLGSWLRNLSIGAGTLTAIVALASKDLISNFFGALVVTVGRPFKVGDWVVVNGLEGRVETIGIRAIKMVTKAGVTIYVPNSVFISKHVHNYGKGVYVAATLEVRWEGVGEEATMAFLEGLRDIVKAYPVLRQGCCRVEVQDIGFAKGRLVVHLYFESMQEEEKVRHMRVLMGKFEGLAKAQGLTLTM